MQNNYKLEKIESICLILIIMTNKLILNIPYYIVDLVGSSAIINIIYIGTCLLPVAFFFTSLIFENSKIKNL